MGLNKEKCIKVILLYGGRSLTKVGDEFNRLHPEHASISFSCVYKLVKKFKQTVEDKLRSGSPQRSTDEETSIAVLGQFAELLKLCELSTTTNGRDVFEAMINCVENCDTDNDKLESICTDGAPTILEKRNGYVSLLEQFSDWKKKAGTTKLEKEKKKKEEEEEEEEGRRRQYVKDPYDSFRRPLRITYSESIKSVFI
ncbi:hypothetical protein ANN_21284 [Periplaneta americana]|uniref:Uncharacterized protein n=1 Tax=Periplaneta americana TaxID=6978 RepID=A0ABQ8SFU1_PERAM|nr:hypothetical protein ANN_21284 [Periplaneta americana]